MNNTSQENLTNDKNYVRYLSREEYRKRKKNLLLSGKKDEAYALSRGVTPHPMMQKHMAVMQESKPAPRISGESGFTKRNINKRNRPVRTNRILILKSDIKRIALNFINKKAFYMGVDEVEITELKEKDVRKVLKAQPNMTIKLGSYTKVNTKKGEKFIRDTITFTSDMFQQVLAQVV